MKRIDFFIVIYTIIILLSLMYATQPLQPLLAEEFNVSIAQASSFTGVIMLFLAIAPIIYGYILERVNAKRVLIVASLILCTTNICLGFSNSYEVFLFLRTCEAVVVPAILTACMSILASDKKNIKLNMSIYVASTVFGGLVGRVMSGLIATQFGWRYVFFSLSLTLLVGLYFIAKLSFTGEATLTKAKVHDALLILKDRRFFVIYLLMFTVFFVFGGVLNILPFRIKEQFPDVTEAHIGLLYLGYGVGIVVSLMIHKIVNIFKKELHAIMFGLFVLIASIILFLNDNIWFIFSIVFVLCFGMFTVHTVSTRLANSMKESQKSLTSGMYLTFYYLGGAVGTIIPAMIYQHFGWEITLATFSGVLIFVAWVVNVNRHHFKAYN
ncbi:MAG: MFS transporter [Candidatus Marinarcus sp.]|uniref:MFS transporter n=1 Tax=Candidatus Marinarcus sp. TaxID=3100987 RepID=UPI003B00575B